MSRIACAQCGGGADLEEEEGFVPSISGGIMGDEYVESYYRCARCDVYTVEIVHDRFLGEEDVSFGGPLSRAKAEPKLALIRQCSRPWSKRCRCPAHQAYFGAWLD